MSLMQFAKAFCLRHAFMETLTWPFFRAYRSGRMALARLRYGIDGNKAVFSAFQGRSCNDNSRAISDKLHEMRPNTDIVWLCRPGVQDVPPYARTVSAVGAAALNELATAKVWVDNFTKSTAIGVAKGQCYIQTWHGDRGFKRIYRDDEWHRERHKLPEQKCSLMVAGSVFGENVYRSAFGYRGKVLREGCPRNDILVNGDPERAARVRAALGIPKDTRVFLYAPTYRDDHKTNAGGRERAVLDLECTLRCLESATGESWILLYRAHYAAAGLDSNAADPRIRDVSAWLEMSELLLISDMLVSDYSSCLADFTLTRRPAFLYIPDIDDYTENRRKLYFDLEKSPFPLAHSMQELETLIRTTDAEKAKVTAEALDAFFGTNETGHATESVCRYIIEQLAGE